MVPLLKLAQVTEINVEAELPPTHFRVSNLDTSRTKQHVQLQG